MIRRLWQSLWAEQRTPLLLLLSCGGILAVTLLLRYGVIAPVAARSQQQLASGRATIGSGSELSAAEVISRGQGDLQAFRSRFPARRDFVKVLAALYGAADASGITLKSINYKEDKSVDGYLVVPVTCQTGGSYLRTKSFLAALQTVPEMIVIDNLGLKQAKDEGVEATLELSIFFRAEGR